MKTTSAEISTYANASEPTASSGVRCFSMTLTMILMLFEYRNIFRARNTRSVRSSRRSFKSRKPEARPVKDGRIDTRSISAMGVTG